MKITKRILIFALTSFLLIGTSIPNTVDAAAKPKVTYLKTSDVTESSFAVNLKAKNTKSYKVWVSTKKTSGFKKLSFKKSDNGKNETFNVSKYNKKALSSDTTYYVKVRIYSKKNYKGTSVAKTIKARTTSASSYSTQNTAQATTPTPTVTPTATPTPIETPSIPQVTTYGEWQNVGETTVINKVVGSDTNDVFNINGEWGDTVFCCPICHEWYSSETSSWCEHTGYRATNSIESTEYSMEQKFKIGEETITYYRQFKSIDMSNAYRTVTTGSSTTTQTYQEYAGTTTMEEPLHPDEECSYYCFNSIITYTDVFGDTHTNGYAESYEITHVTLNRRYANMYDYENGEMIIAGGSYNSGTTEDAIWFGFVKQDGKWYYGETNTFDENPKREYYTTLDKEVLSMDFEYDITATLYQRYLGSDEIWYLEKGVDY